MKLKKLFEDNKKPQKNSDDALGAWLSGKPTQSKPKKRGKPSKLTDTGEMVGSLIRMPPERLQAMAKGERFGGEPIATELINQLPPFPYHPKGNPIKDPEAQIYWTLQALGPLSWIEVQAEIAPYLKKLKMADRDLPSKEDYVAAMTELLKRQVVHKVADGRYAAF